jgi:hypothetical protein
MIRRPAEAAFAAVARWRAGRALHTHGTVIDGELELDIRSAIGRVLGPPAARRAVFRASKSIGTPDGSTDLLGMAIRIPVGDTVVDILFASTGTGRLTRLLLVPSAQWWGRPYSTLLPYRVGGRAMLLGIDPVDGPPAGADPADVAASVASGPVELVVTEWPLPGRRRPAGRLRLDVVPEPGPAVTFDPVLNSLPGLRPVRFLAGLREWAYTGSRRGRKAEDVDSIRLPGGP